MALLLQGMSMYFFSALLKSDDRWFPDGTAVYYALQLDYFATTFALWFRQFESLLAGLTYYVHLLEFIGPLLIFSPVFFRQCRALTLLAFITLHLGLFLCLEIGIFWLVSIVMNLLFLPAWVWNKLGDWFNQQPNYKVLQERVIRLVPSNTLKYETSAVKHHRSSTVVSAIAGIVLLFVTVQNLSTLPALNIELPRKFVEVRQLLGLYQNWTMFAPYPEVTSPWPVIAGQLRNGTVVDVYEQSEEAPNFRKPAIVSRVYENYRWRKYLSNMEDRTWEPVPQNLAINYSRYLCRLWNSSHSNEKRLMSLDINFMVERTPIPGQRKLAERRHVWSWKCR